MPKLRQQRYLGVDPGNSGALVFLTNRSTEWVRLSESTERDIWEALRKRVVVRAVIEQVHSFPKQGVASTFKFGVSYGMLRMALIAAEMPFEAVSPQKWQRYYGIIRKKGESKTSHKRRLKARAQELFPSVRVTLAVADALLLAEYARRLHSG